MGFVSQQIRVATGRVVDSLQACEAGAVGADAAGSVPLSVSQPVPLSALLAGLTDAQLTALVRDAAAARAQFERVLTVGAGVIAKRSQRESGYTGLSSREGHRSPVGLIQSLTGATRGEAARQVRFGEAIGEADAATQLLADSAGTDSSDADLPGTDLPDADSDDSSSPTPSVPWFEPITRAVTDGVITTAGGDALMRGLGQPSQTCDTEMLREAANELVARAADASAGANGTVATDELAKWARWLRDRVDPAGVSERAEEHHAGRKARLWRNSDDVLTAWIQFDDESANLIEGTIRAGLSPRLGGPRFVDNGKAAKAKALAEDPRSYEQLVFDLLIATLKAGTLADPTILLGGQQHGLRVVITKNQLNKKNKAGDRVGTGFVEDTGETVPPRQVERLLCDTGITEITVNDRGDPLNVGREHRLFTPKQRIALAIRDGGCMGPDCPYPPSLCEAHHSQEWDAHHGLTNINDGILLCKFHHLRIHNLGYQITRRGGQYYMVPPASIDPEQTPVPLESKAPWLTKRHTA